MAWRTTRAWPRGRAVRADRLRQSTAAGWNQTSSATGMALLVARRHHSGYTTEQVSRADGRWSEREVLALEAHEQVGTEQLLRYHRALAKLDADEWAR